MIESAREYMRDQYPRLMRSDAADADAAREQVERELSVLLQADRVAEMGGKIPIVAYGAGGAFVRVIHPGERYSAATESLEAPSRPPRYEEEVSDGK